MMAMGALLGYWVALMLWWAYETFPRQKRRMTEEQSREMLKLLTRKPVRGPYI